MVADTQRRSGHVETIRIISARQASRKEQAAAHQLIAIRLDPDVLRRLPEEARRHKVGYQTLITRVLADYARNYVAWPPLSPSAPFRSVPSPPPQLEQRNAPRLSHG